MKKQVILPRALLAFISVLLVCVLFAARPLQAAEKSTAEVEEKSSSMQMMERVETIVYGEPGRGGLIERLNSIEKELFGRSLPGSISERHTAILNFLETGTADQPSMLFKLGVAEWIVRQNVQSRRSALKRLESLESELDGELQYGRPVAMRLERILANLVADPVVFEERILPSGTVLKVRFLEELGPAKTKKGDAVELELTDDLFVDRSLAAPRGSQVESYVGEVRQPGRGGVPSKISLQFKSLIPLGPQRPPVSVGEASGKATEEAKKGQSKGEGAIIGAGATAIGGAVLLGPVGLLGALFVRGDAIKIPEGSIMFVETSGDARVSVWPVPASLHIDPGATIRDSVVSTTTTTTTTTVTTTTVDGGTTGQDTIELPPEQKID